jgi:hypothetical protein
MSHDLYADWACVEIARLIQTFPQDYFDVRPNNLSAYATREGGRIWPICDGVVCITEGDSTYNLAIEMKRVNEGLHGVLTAIGQSQAYLHKGFNASVIVVPNQYVSHENPGLYISDVIALVSDDQPILIFSYEEPNPSLPNPFLNKLTRHRGFNLNTARVTNTTNIVRRTETQWGHVREGSTDPHAFYTYLATAKKYGINDDVPINVTIPNELTIACTSFQNFNGDIFKYLSNSSGDSFHDKVWRKFWFENIIHTEALPLFHRVENNYTPVDVPSKIFQPNGQPKKFFVGKTNSKKNVLCQSLNNKETTEANAWIEYASNIRNRAHSYREDVDSGLAAFGLLEDDGKPTPLAYKYVDAVERYNDWNASVPKNILGYALLANANFLSLLHYIYRLTEEEMTQNNFSFYIEDTNHFNKEGYLAWLRNKLANELHVMRTVTERGGQGRQPFQAEFAVLRQYEFVKNFRLGVGLEINWPLIHEVLDSVKNQVV